MYLIIILVIFIGGAYFLFNYVNKKTDNEVEVLEEDRSSFPKRALVPTDILFRLAERDMSVGRENDMVFYYKLVEHHLGVTTYQDKLIYKYDGKLYMTMNDLKNTALLGEKRLADVDDKVTLTEIIYKGTNVSSKLEQDNMLKDYIVSGTDKLYDLNMVEEEHYE